MTFPEVFVFGLALVLIAVVRFSATSSSRTGDILTVLAVLAVVLVVVHQAQRLWWP